LERLPDQPGDVPITSADVSKASRDLAYRPQTSLADGLRKFADWYLAERSKGTER
jgi:UDP-glucuronate 4-epimerase